MAKSTQQKIAENRALWSRTNAAFERLDFPRLFVPEKPTEPTDVPNRLFGASINEDGEAI